MSLINFVFPEHFHLKLELVGEQAKDIKTILELLFDNNLKLKKIMGDTTQAVADLKAIVVQLKKIGTESATSLDLIKKLEDAANNNPSTPQEVVDVIAEVKAQAQIVDDLVPDATEPPPTEQPPTDQPQG